MTKINLVCVMFVTLLLFELVIKKQLRNKKHLENEMIIPERLFQDSIEIISEVLYNLRSLREIAREKFGIDDKQLKIEVARETNNPYYFTDRAIQLGFNITLDSHRINQANSEKKYQTKQSRFRNWSLT